MKPRTKESASSTSPMRVAAARNAGLDAACGKYIGFADPDDYVFSRHVPAPVSGGGTIWRGTGLHGATIAGDMPLSSGGACSTACNARNGTAAITICVHGNVQRIVLGQALPCGFPEKTGLRFREGNEAGERCPVQQPASPLCAEYCQNTGLPVHLPSYSSGFPG